MHDAFKRQQADLNFLKKAISGTSTYDEHTRGSNHAPFVDPQN